MEEVSDPEVMKRFAALMDGFIASPPATAKVIVDAVVELYRTVQVKGARDKLQFEWASNTPHKLTRFTNIRHDTRTEDVEWEDKKFQWVGVSWELSESDEDDSTCLCAFLYFRPARKEEPMGSVVTRRQKLDERLGKFFGDANVAKLLASRPSRITAFATEVG